MAVAPIVDSAQLRILHEVQFPFMSADEFRWFVQQCEARGIHPGSRHVYCRRQWNALRDENELLILLSIDGFRAVAVETGEFDGSDGPVWAGPDLNWSEVWTDDVHPPYAAKFRVYRKGSRRAVWRTVKWTEFAQYNDAGQLLEHWRKMPSHVLGLRAEAAGLRAAFPERLGGIYTPDEIPDSPPRDAGRAPVMAARTSAVQTDQFPQTLMQLELALLDKGYRDPAARKALIEHWSKRFPLPAANNPPKLYGLILQNAPDLSAAVAANPGA